VATELDELYRKLGASLAETDVKRVDGVWSLASDSKWITTGVDKPGKTGGTCSGSLSPDGRSVTGLIHGHERVLLTRICSGGVQGEVKWV